MSRYDRDAQVEVVLLPNGRYGIQVIGDDVPDEDAGEFATQAEAEEWLYDQVERREELRDEPDVLKPGGGQGIR